MDYILLGQRIRRYRQVKKLTQEQLAELADISASFMGHIERGSRVASLDTLMKICAALGVTPNDLLGVDVLPGAVNLPEKISVSPKRLISSVALLLMEQENLT